MRRAVMGVLTAVAVCLGGQACAQDNDPFAGLQPLGDDALASKRGGMLIGGYEVEFGVVVTAGDQLVSSLTTDLEALRDALAGVGQDPSVYVDGEGMVDLDGLTTVVVNTQDDVRIEHFVRIDVVIEGGMGGTLNAVRDTFSLVGLPETLPRF